MPRKPRKRTPAENRAIYARRKAQAKKAGTTVYGIRDAQARARGWEGYGQYRKWNRYLSDDRIRELAEEIGGPVEPDREGSLMSREANAIINPRGVDRRPGDWRIRLLIASGRMEG